MKTVTIETQNPWSKTLTTQTIDFAAMTQAMDDEIRESLHLELATCSNQKFANEYVKKHFEKYGEYFYLA